MAYTDHIKPCFMTEEELQGQTGLAPKKKKGKIWLLIGLVVVLLLSIGGGIGYYYYNLVMGQQLNSLQEDMVLEIRTGSSLEQISNMLKDKGLLGRAQDFLWVAGLMKYTGKAGRYRIGRNTQSYYQLLKTLRGAQEPLMLTFNNLRLKEQVAGLVARVLELDSADLAHILQHSERLEKYGLNPDNAMSLFIPNSYQFLWNTNADAFMERMYEENQRFWKAEGRLAKADSLGLSPTEVYILASIVDAEPTYAPEKPRVAGVYLNRLRTPGWRLEADPTVVFAKGDFSVRRVTLDMLEIDSPYNTYKNAGLPPGPIRMASTSAIDAVLNAEQHDYWFFCAKPPSEGEPPQHAFAKTAAQHGANAKKYRAWLNTQRIYR